MITVLDFRSRSRFRIDNQESRKYIYAISIPEISGKSRFRIASPISISYTLSLCQLSSSYYLFLPWWGRLLMALTSWRPRRCRWTCLLIWTASTILNSRWETCFLGGTGREGLGRWEEAAANLGGPRVVARFTVDRSFDRTYPHRSGFRSCR